ncbi:hypothetical protein O3M35_003668 [Rhynocoris fuscipes]|uniref:Uncharacterized protein n=1 Tax=Rhynocoris fuscipes TaxID=488301 RepID=A0AAW1CRI2_9HEMI
MYNRSALFGLLIIIINSLNTDAAPPCPARSNQYYYDPYQDEDMRSEGEEMCTLPMATLRTILRGLVAVLAQIFPECASAVEKPGSINGCQEKKEEPIKIFRQIVSCPSLSLPYYPCCPPPPTQIPAPPTIMHTSV